MLFHQSKYPVIFGYSVIHCIFLGLLLLLFLIPSAVRFLKQGNRFKTLAFSLIPVSALCFVVYFGASLHFLSFVGVSITDAGAAPTGGRGRFPVRHEARATRRPGDGAPIERWRRNGAWETLRWRSAHCCRLGVGRGTAQTLSSIEVVETRSAPFLISAALIPILRRFECLVRRIR